MIKNLLSINKKGLSHTQCEDSIFINAEAGTFIVCDGVSSVMHGREGAQALSSFMGEALSSPELQERFSTASASAVRKEVVKLIKECTDATANELGCKAIDLSCTFIAVIVCKDTITVLHAGDGAVFAAPAVEQNECPLLVSHPDNDSSYRVYPAAAPQQLTRMRVMRVKASDIKALALGSDGFTDSYIKPCQCGFDGISLNEVWALQSNEELKKLVKRRHLEAPPIQDDISAIVVKFDNYEKGPQPVHASSFEANPEDDGNEPDNNDNEPMDDNNEIEIVQKEEYEPQPESKPKKKKRFNLQGALLSVLSILIACCIATIGWLYIELESMKVQEIKQSAETADTINELQNRVDELEKLVDDIAYGAYQNNTDSKKPQGKDRPTFFGESYREAYDSAG